MTFAPVQNRLGVQPVGTAVTCVNKSGGTLVVGDLVITSFIHAGAVVNPEQAASTSYVFNCVRKAVSTETGNTGYLGVVTKLLTGAGGNGYNVEVQFGGICSAKVLVDATVTSGTLLGISATAGVLSNSVSTSDYSVTLMDNAAVADGTALKRVYIPTEYTFGSTSSSIPGFYGSNRAGAMLRDAIAKTDSLDVIIIGDSNAGDPSNNGYTVGFQRVMQLGFRIPIYATPLLGGGPTSETSLTVGNTVGEGLWGIGVAEKFNANTEAGGSNSGTTFKQMIQSTDTNIVGLRDWLGFNFTNYTSALTDNLSLFPLGWMSNPAVVETGARFTSDFNNYVGLMNQTASGLSAFGSELVFGTNGLGAGTSLEYRIVYGTFPVSGGSFKPYAFYLGTGGTALRDSVTTPTSGGYGYATKRLPVPSVVLGATGVQPNRICFTWDGANSATTADQANGPFACLWKSIIRPNFKGYSVSCLNYKGGATTTQIAAKIEDCDKMLDAYLKEIRERQIGATPGTAGTGRVMVFLNSGINGTETSALWIAGAERIRNRIAERWVSTGGSLSQLSFVLTPTHPTDTAASNWTTNGAAITAAACAWATTNANDGYGVSVVDISSAYTPMLLTKYQLYNDPTTAIGQAHLKRVTISPVTVNTVKDGYESVAQFITSTLLASA